MLQNGTLCGSSLVKEIRFATPIKKIRIIRKRTGRSLETKFNRRFDRVQKHEIKTLTVRSLLYGGHIFEIKLPILRNRVFRCFHSNTINIISKRNCSFPHFSKPLYDSRMN